ncbi:MAG: hypothetical protein ABFS30_15665, partial [Pseudomonadota bacterium]
MGPGRHQIEAVRRYRLTRNFALVGLIVAVISAAGLATLNHRSDLNTLSRNAAVNRQITIGQEQADISLHPAAQFRNIGREIRTEYAQVA